MVPTPSPRPARPGLALAAALAALASGCGKDLECTELGIPASVSFVVDLDVPEGDLPADLVITLTGGGVSQAITSADLAAAQPGDPCVLDAGVVTCLWGSGGPARGTFDATAAGHRPVHLDLTAVEDECGGVRAAEQEVALQPE